jgi:hypothetical protein
MIKKRRFGYWSAGVLVMHPRQSTTIWKISNVDMPNSWSEQQGLLLTIPTGWKKRERQAVGVNVVQRRRFHHHDGHQKCRGIEKKKKKQKSVA